jgi:5'-deoxynucleotidase YfbR-like HD superfamily hydrolase
MVTILFAHFAKLEKIGYDAKVLEVIMHHDILEVVTGDLPYTIKNLSSSTKACWSAIETETAIEFPSFDEYTDENIKKAMTKKQYKLFRACDLLDLWIFLAEENRLGNSALPIHEIRDKCVELIGGKFKSIDEYMTYGYTF